MSDRQVIWGFNLLPRSLILGSWLIAQPTSAASNGPHRRATHPRRRFVLRSLELLPADRNPRERGSRPLNSIVRPSGGISIESWVIRNLSLKGPINLGLAPLPCFHDSTIYWLHAPHRSESSSRSFTGWCRSSGSGAACFNAVGHPGPNLPVSADRDPRERGSRPLNSDR
jgi:hypothetical protein